MPQSKKNPLLSGVMAGYLVLLIHLILVIFLATAVVFIQGLSQYIEYILGGGVLLILGSGAFFYRLLKQNGKQILNTLQNPSFQGQNIEVSLLGGLASISIKGAEKSDHFMLGNPAQELRAIPELPPTASPHNDLLRLSELYDRGLISKEEFIHLKDDLLNSDKNQSQDSVSGSQTQENGPGCVLRCGNAGTSYRRPNPDTF